MGAELINVHGGRDAWSIEEGIRFLSGNATPNMAMSVKLLVLHKCSSYDSGSECANIDSGVAEIEAKIGLPFVNETHRCVCAHVFVCTRDEQSGHSGHAFLTGLCHVFPHRQRLFWNPWQTVSASLFSNIDDARP
jgi:hypothetical protein